MLHSYPGAASLACVLLAGMARAELPPAPELPSSLGAAPMTLATALERTLERNPQLRGFAFRLRAQEGRAQTASLSPPLELRAELENIAGTGAAGGIDSTEATFALSRVIELGGKRARRMDVARAEYDSIEAESQSAQLDVLAELARRFVHVASDQEQLALTRRATELARETLEATQQRVAAARAPVAELHRARVALARARIDEEHAEHELLASRMRLAAMWGETEARFGPVTADLYAMPALAGFEPLAQRLENNPDLLRFVTEERLRDAQIRLAETEARANLGLQAGIRHLQTTDDQAFVLGFALPLFHPARAQGAVTEARARRAQTEAEREAHRVRIHAELYGAWQELGHAITETQTLREQVLPEIEAALEATEYAYSRGRYGYLEWVDAQRELLSVRRALIGAATSVHQYRIEIERLTGEPLPTAPERKQP